MHLLSFHLMYLQSMNESKKVLLFFCFFFLIALVPAVAQKSKAQLEKEKKENLQKISDAERILSQTASEKKTSLGQLAAINQQVAASEALIKSYNSEVVLLDKEMSELNTLIVALESDLENLKKEYAAMVYAASKARAGNTQLTFLFSAKTFNQFLRRYQYMKQYGKARKNQVEQIEKVTAALIEQKSSIEAKRIEKSILLNQQVKQSQNLLALKTRQDNVLKSLTQRETELKKELASRKEAVGRLDKLIADLVKKEIEASSKGASKSKISLTPEAALLSSSFEGNKSRLLWPVTSGFISSKFGTHPHPVLKGIMIDNQGIDIQTNQNETVRAVFDGLVKTVAMVPGMNNVVIVQHGDYFTLYARLKKVQVRPGQKVAVKEVIGEVYTDKDGIAELQFQIWKNNTKLDPETWLYTK